MVARTHTEDIDMAWFLFAGDMLVMLFMVLLVMWVSTGASRSTLDYSARIPLDDEQPAKPARERQS